MHIPDGFLSPETYLTLYAIHTPLLVYSFGKLKIQKKDLPLMTTLSGFAYLITSIQIPIAGGTSIHLTGLVILTKFLGLWKTYLIYSILFFIQSLLLGLGGITSIPLLSISMGWISPFIILNLDRIVNINFRIKMIFLNSVGIFSSIFVISFVLGLQPLIANQNGKPLFFPYPWDVVFLAMFLGHLPVMVIESIVSILFFEFYEKYYKYK
ncbi:MAG: energy-coupling factor ABC transporter permease [Leptonema sp. (in: bacteria)]